MRWGRVDVGDESWAVEAVEAAASSVFVVGGADNDLRSAPGEKDAAGDRAGDRPVPSTVSRELRRNAEQVLRPRVDAKARICVRQRFYSVPALYVGRRLTTRLSATTVEVMDGAKVVARHERAVAKYAEVLMLDHYLEALQVKPDSLPGAAALAQATAAGVFTTTHQRYWDASRRARGDTAGTKALIEVLLAHRSVPADTLLTAMSAAVDNDLLDPQGVLIEARRHAAATVAPVVPIGALARYDRRTPSLSGYDELLSGNSA